MPFILQCFDVLKQKSILHCDLEINMYKTFVPSFFKSRSNVIIHSVLFVQEKEKYWSSIGIKTILTDWRRHVIRGSFSLPTQQVIIFKHNIDIRVPLPTTKYTSPQGKNATNAGADISTCGMDALRCVGDVADLGRLWPRDTQCKLFYLYGCTVTERMKERRRERERTRETGFATRSRQRRVLSAAKLKRSAVFWGLVKRNVMCARAWSWFISSGPLVIERSRSSWRN